MMKSTFPEMITNLPEAEVGVEGVSAWISQGPANQVVFVDIEPSAQVPPHRHGEQWGIVVQGEMDLVVNGETSRLGPGDIYHVPAGATHSARFLSRFRAIDVFAEPDRYKAKHS